MEHRYVTNHSITQGLHQHVNSHSPMQQAYTPMGRDVATDNGQFVPPIDHTFSGGLNSHANLGSRSLEHHPSFFNMEIQHFPPSFSRPPVGPYTPSSTSGNTSVAPIGLSGHSHYNVPAGNGGQFKRKNPGISGASSSSFHGDGISSNPQMDSMRNVRSRYVPEFEPSMTRSHVPSYGSQYNQTTTHSANYPVYPVNISADVTSQEWNSAPYAASSSHGWTSPPNIFWDGNTYTNGLGYEPSQFYAGGSFVDIDTCYHNPFSQGSLVPSSHGPNYNYGRGGPNYNFGRVTPWYRNGPYCNYTNGGNSSTNELQFPSENISSRYARQSQAGGWGSGHMNGWPMMAFERPQPIVDVIDAHDRLGHETLTVDQLSFFHNFGNFSDEYQDMRLDIDNMSYEELLALEERIGSVSTGMSEDGMSNCLKEQVYCSVDQNHEDATCSIFLDEYKNGEKVGRMERCGHDYHVDCIKKWLLVKKVCPICKADCSNQA